MLSLKQYQTRLIGELQNSIMTLRWFPCFINLDIMMIKKDIIK